MAAISSLTNEEINRSDALTLAEKIKLRKISAALDDKDFALARFHINEGGGGAFTLAERKVLLRLCGAEDDGNDDLTVANLKDDEKTRKRINRLATQPNKAKTLWRKFWQIVGDNISSILVEDTFTDTNGTFIQDHTPETDVGGGGWRSSRNASYPHLSITDGVLRNTGLNSGPQYGLIDVGAWTTLTHTVTLVNSAITYCFPRYLFRVQSTVYDGTANFFEVVIDPNGANNRVYLQRYLANTGAIVDTVNVTAPLESSEITITIIDDGTNIAIAFSHGGDDYTLSTTDTSLASATEVGIGSSRNTISGASYLKVSA